MVDDGMHLFKDGKSARYIYNTMLSQNSTSSSPVCHIFVDSSNVGVSETNIPGLSAIAHRGFGTVHTAVVVGTTPSPSDRAALWENLGYTARFTVRAHGQPESAYNVDATLVSWIQRAMRVYRGQESNLVVVTGDGNDNEGDPSFCEVVRHALEDRWKVRLVCYRPNPLYRTMQREFPSSLQIVPITPEMIAEATANPAGAIVGHVRHSTGSCNHLPVVHVCHTPPAHRIQAAHPVQAPSSAAMLHPVPYPQAAAPATNAAVRKQVAAAAAAAPRLKPQAAAPARKPEAAAVAQDPGEMLLRMVDKALAAGSTRFEAAVGRGCASFKTW
jgi:hypothetical protein